MLVVSWTRSPVWFFNLPFFVQLMLFFISKFSWNVFRHLRLDIIIELILRKVQGRTGTFFMLCWCFPSMFWLHSWELSHSVIIVSGREVVDTNSLRMTIGSRTRKIFLPFEIIFWIVFILFPISIHFSAHRVHFTWTTKCFQWLILKRSRLAFMFFCEVHNIVNKEFVHLSTRNAERRPFILR